jgi:hypothetical protein
VGKENKVQKDLFGTLSHDELDVFRWKWNLGNKSAYLQPFIDGVLIL